MTPEQPMTPQERALRERLQASLVPPATPEGLLVRLDAIADGAMRAGRPRRPLLSRGVSLGHPGLAARMRIGLAVAATIVLVASALAAGIGLRGQPSVAATPFPALPSGAPEPVDVVPGAWVSPDVAWVRDHSNRIYLTNDGGMTWSEPRWLPPVDFLSDLAFRDAANGWAVHAPQQVAEAPIDVYLTHDGARTWSKTTVGTIPSAAEGHRLNVSLHFSDAQRGVVLATDSLEPGGSGTDFVPVTCLGWTTDDGGGTWQPIAGAPCAVSVEAWASPEVGLVTGVDNGTPAIWLTRDGGRTWVRGRFPSDMPSAGVLLFTLASDGTPQLVTRPGWASMETRTTVPGALLETRDGGRSWVVVREVAPPADGLGSAGSVVVGPDHWLVTWISSLASGRRVYETRDGGRTWSQGLALPDTVLGVYWLDRLHAMATGQDLSTCSSPSASPCNDLVFLLTNDGGATWHGFPVEDPRFAPRPSASASAPTLSAPSATSATPSSPSTLDIETLASDVQAYGSTVADEFGGVYIDQANSRVVALFTGNLEQHRQAILDQIGGSAPIDVRQVKYSERELRALQDRITADAGSSSPDWMRALGAVITTIGVDVMANRTTVSISSTNPAAPAAIAAHYGVPADMLLVESDGTGVALMPRGWVDVSVKVGSGVAVPQGGWLINLKPDGAGSWNEGLVGWSVLPGKVQTGISPATVGGWTVNLLDESNRIVASGHVTIVADRHVPLVITVK